MLYSPKGKSKNPIPVAVKCIENAIAFNDEDFKREIRLTSKCDHKNVVKFIGWFKKEGKLHLVTEYIDGGNLREYLMSPLNVRSKKFTKSAKILDSEDCRCFFINFTNN
jgi:serine/threonine protein kinase